MSVTSSHLPPAPVESALWAAALCHKGVRASTAHPGGQTIGASPPPQKLQPLGKSTVALINVGMWFGMKTGTRPSVVVTNVKCYCGKSRAAYVPSCPLPAFFFFSGSRSSWSSKKVSLRSPKGSIFLF